MFTIFWLISWLLKGDTTFVFGSGGAFWALIVAIIADVFLIGGYRTGWLIRRP